MAAKTSEEREWTLLPIMPLVLRSWFCVLLLTLGAAAGAWLGALVANRGSDIELNYDAVLRRLDHVDEDLREVRRALDIAREAKEQGTGGESKGGE